jgi:hypothetical protein
VIGGDKGENQRESQGRMIFVIQAKGILQNKWKIIGIICAIRAIQFTDIILFIVYLAIVS